MPGMDSCFLFLFLFVFLYRGPGDFANILGRVFATPHHVDIGPNRKSR